MNIKQVYFIGIGGIGMSNLARYFKAKGRAVAGYDRTPSPLTRALEAEGMQIHYEDDVRQIPAAFLDTTTTLVVRTPAVPASHSELCHFQARGFTVMKRAEVLGEISREGRALCVSGTHGKTTTSTLLAHLLTASGKGCNAFLGGISKNYGTNLLLDDHSDLAVFEADEYDRSFHHLSPWMAVVTAVDADHLDIYGTHEAYIESFAHFTELIREGGALVMKYGLALRPRTGKGVSCYTYAASVTSPRAALADFYSDNVTVRDARLFFDFHYPAVKGCPAGVIRGVELGVPMMIHVENATAAMAIGLLNGLTPDELAEGVRSFQGNLRRFDFQVRKPGFLFVDDYAHHPDELKASIASLRMLCPDRRLTGVFQPHLYTRTRDFAAEFAAALSALDEVILLDIYPARELPIEGVTSQLIFDRITSPAKSMSTLDDIVPLLKTKQPEVLMTLGAGNIDRIVPLLKAEFEK